MADSSRGNQFGGSIPQMPNFRGAGPRILRWAVAILVVLLLFWSTTSIPTETSACSRCSDA